MSEEKKIILAHDGMNPFSIYYPNPYTGKRETYKFPMYKPGSKRDRTIAVSEDCYQWLKDETTSFKEGYLRVVTENIPASIKEQQEEAQQEVIGVLLAPSIRKHTVVPCPVTKKQQILGSLVGSSSTIV